MLWLVMAVLSALFAGLTAVLAKCGIKNTDSDIATALRTIVVWIFSWIMVLIVGAFDTITQISTKSLLFLILSGLATGASWICYFKALSVGDINKVIPVDKSSTILSVLLAIIAYYLLPTCCLISVNLWFASAIFLKSLPLVFHKEKKYSIEV